MVVVVVVVVLFVSEKQKDLEIARSNEKQTANLLEQKESDFRAQMQLKVREFATRETMYEEVRFREVKEEKGRFWCCLFYYFLKDCARETIVASS